MPTTENTKYLGVNINKKIDPKHEIKARISATMPTLKKLDIFWRKTNCSTKWKLIVYNAVIVSKLLYGLETIEPSNSTAKLLDTFQLRGLRKILNLKTTFIERGNTNENIFIWANQAINSPIDFANRTIKPLSEVLENRRLKLLGHIIRRDRSHPLHQVTFLNNNLLPRTTENRRQGRPRLSWIRNNMEKAWRQIVEEEMRDDNVEDIEDFDFKDDDIPLGIRLKIKQAAILYKAPFQKGI
jgi:hypothetical protein